MEKLWPLVASFVIIGVGAYGGGLVTVPLMQHELVEGRQFFSLDEMSKIVAIAQMTPGPIAVNGATFVGFRVAGIVGALIATLVVVLPGVSTLAVVSYVRRRMNPSYHLLRLRRGLRAGVLSLLLYAAWRYGWGVINAPIELAIAAGAFLILIVFEGKVHPLAVIAGAGIVGLLVF
ncbi:MAG: chromate transporter [Planctomycetota bacterium]